MPDSKKVNSSPVDSEFESFPKCCLWETSLTQHLDTCLLNLGYKRLKKNYKCSSCGVKRAETYLQYPNLIGESTPGPLCFYCAWMRLSDAGQPHDVVVPDRLHEAVEVYADGGLLGMNRFGGTWSWCAVNKDGLRIAGASGIVLEPPSGRKVTNNHTEQIAIIKALESLPDNWSGQVCSDSKIALGRIFKNYRESNLPRNIARRSADAVVRLGQIETINLQGHPTERDLRMGMGEKRGLPVSIHNVWCDAQCEAQRDLYFETYGPDGHYSDMRAEEII